MALTLSILGWSFFGLAIVAGLLLDLVGLFGNWIILAAAALAWVATGFTHFNGWTMAILVALAVAGEVLETLAAGYGAAKYGGGKGAIVAALIGCLVGALVGTPLFPIIGTLIGACAGAFLFAAAYEYLALQKRPDEALRTGFGAALGKVLGLFAKLLCGFMMLLAMALTF